MKDLIRRWLGMPPLSSNAVLGSETTALLIESYKAHITDLQKEVERLQSLVQVLSDDKFFKPQVIPQDLGPVVSETPFVHTDWEFQTDSSDAAPEKEEPEFDLQSEIDGFSKEFTEYQGKRGK